MNTDYSFGRNSLLSLAAVILLSPALRLFPSASAALAGRGAWLSALLALLPLALYVLFLCRFTDCRLEGEGMAELIERSLHPRFGRAALVLFGLWFTFYAGFILRSGADRFITTVYPNSSPAVFSIVMGSISLFAALGSARAIVRVAKMVLPLVFGVLLPVLITALFSVDGANLLPLRDADAVPVLTGAVPAIDVCVVVLYSVTFLESSTPKEAGERGAFLVWTAIFCVFLSLLSLAVVGSFGHELASSLTRPFFSLVRNLVFFRTVERIEALVVSLWVFPDFLTCSVLLYAAQFCFRLALGKDAQYHGEGIDDMSGGRAVIWFCTTAAIVCAVLLAPTPERLSLWSEKIIPGINMTFAFVILPGIFIIGKLKRRI